MALIHYSPRYNDYELKDLLTEAQSVFPETVLSKDRMTFEIPNEDQYLQKMIQVDNVSKIYKTKNSKNEKETVAVDKISCKFNSG